jgi:hypothetical protein
MKRILLLILSFFSMHNIFAGNLFDKERVMTVVQLIPILESYSNLVQLRIAHQVSKKLTEQRLREISHNKFVHKRNLSHR